MELTCNCISGEDVFHNGNPNSDMSLQDLIRWPDKQKSSWMSKRDACFFLLVTIPIICALLQLAAWSRFTLHGARLNQIKSIRLSRTTDVV